jgi:hypothetical protein
MPRGGDTSAKARANGKKAGRPAKPAILLKADRGVATTVLSMDGPPPDHQRECKCDICSKREKLCRCERPEYKEKKLTCEACSTAKEHSICHCEVCGWWEVLLARDMRLRKDGREYLTNRRDGKPAQGVFLGDTREHARELDFGDLPELIAAGKSGAAGKPN